MSSAERFEALRTAFEQTEIIYAVGGSWANTAFGDLRFTNDIDILAEIMTENLDRFLRYLPRTLYVDREGALNSLGAGRPFNVIHMPTVLKCDSFPSSAFPLGAQELDRAIVLANTGLSQTPALSITSEAKVLAKLHWFRAKGEVSETQWRDIRAAIGPTLPTLDLEYLEEGAVKRAVLDLLHKVLGRGVRDMKVGLRRRSFFSVIIRAYVYVRIGGASCLILFSPSKNSAPVSWPRSRRSVISAVVP